MLKEKDSLTEQIIGSCFKVHKKLGPGYNEKIYQNALKLQLECDGLICECEKEYKVNYLDKFVGTLRIDLIIEKRVIVEIKAISTFVPKVFENQVISYLKSSQLDVGLLVNFGNNSCQIRRLMKSHNSHCKSL